MPRFYLEIVDGIEIEDPVGMVCKSEAQAIDVAQSIARQIEIDVKNSGARKGARFTTQQPFNQLSKYTVNKRLIVKMTGFSHAPQLAIVP